MHASVGSWEMQVAALQPPQLRHWATRAFRRREALEIPRHITHHDKATRLGEETMAQLEDAADALAAADVGR